MTGGRGKKRSMDDRAQENVDEILQALEGFDKKTRALIKSIRLTTVDDMSQETKDLWTNSTTTWPQIFESEHCFNRDPPSSTDLILATLDEIQSKDSTVSPFSRGEKAPKVDPRTSIAQLYEPKLTNPVSLIGLNLAIVPDDLFTTPLSLSEFVEPFDHSNLQLLLTLKFCVTDLHIDSADGLSQPLGLTEKLWLTFPPTAKNLAFMAKAEGQKQKLTRIGKQLEGGLILKTTAAHAIYLPVGCIHGVITTHGGFLLANDFNTTISSKTFAALFSAGLDRVDGGHFQREYFDRFLSSVNLGLDNNRVQLALSAWVDSLERTREWAEEKTNAGWVKKAGKMWDKFVETPQARKLVCPCGKGKGGFKEHFKVSHSLTQPTAAPIKGVRSSKRIKLR